MFRKKRLFVLGAIVCIVSGAGAASAQGIIVRVMGGGGYTAVDFEGASGYADSTLENWNQTNYSFALQALFKVAPSVRVGGEAGWEHLYYWYHIIPYGPSPVYRELDVATMFVGGLAQLFLARSLYVLGGVDLHFFNSSTALGVSAGIGGQFRVSDKVAVPLEFRVKPVLGDGTPMVLQINTGVAFGSGR
jgi:hypothetical protein